MSIKNVNATEHFHQSNLIIGVRLLDSAVAILKGVDFSALTDDENLEFSSELSVSSLSAELTNFNYAFDNLLTGDPE